MTRDAFTPEQEAATVELEHALGVFATALDSCRAAELPVVDAFRAAGIEIPTFVPGALLENLFAPAPA